MKPKLLILLFFVSSLLLVSCNKSDDDGGDAVTLNGIWHLKNVSGCRLRPWRGYMEF